MEKYCPHSFKGISIDDAVEYLASEIAKIKKTHHDDKHKVLEVVNKLHEELHWISEKKFKELENKIFELWKVLPTENKTVTKEYFREVLRNYYTKAESNLRFDTEPISEREIKKVAKLVFGE